MNLTNPALVSQRAVARLPRWALISLVACYVLPGMLGRDPWKNNDVESFGYMLNLARGWCSWWQPAIAGVSTHEGGLLPYWLGAASIKWCSPWLEPAIAARLPFIALLCLVLALTWYATYLLARDDAAQPLPFAFGGEAKPIDYARTIADGALLALIATLGLLQLGHETTPEMVQWVAMSMCMASLCAMRRHPYAAQAALTLSLLIFSSSGAPSVALILGASALLLLALDTEGPRLSAWITTSIAMLLAAGLAWRLHAWAWQVQAPASLNKLLQLLLWFIWPSWLLAGWTVWRWRHHWQERHIMLPLMLALVGLGVSVGMGGSTPALMLAAPPLAVLAAFALPTLKRSVGAAIDWFSLFFFSSGVLFFWVIYLAAQTGWPRATARNIHRLIPGFHSGFSWPSLLIALAGSAAWLAIVRWRTSHQRHPLWKTLALPAVGIVTCWLLLMSLCLPMLDHARSYRSLVGQVRTHVPTGKCIYAMDAPRGMVASLQYFADYQIFTAAGPAQQCDYALVAIPARAALPPQAPGWQRLAIIRQRSVNSESAVVYKRQAN